MNETKAGVGVIGMALMGRNLALNINQLGSVPHLVLPQELQQHQQHFQFNLVF